MPVNTRSRGGEAQPLPPQGATSGGAGPVRRSAPRRHDVQPYELQSAAGSGSARRSGPAQRVNGVDQGGKDEISASSQQAPPPSTRPHPPNQHPQQSGVPPAPAGARPGPAPPGAHEGARAAAAAAGPVAAVAQPPPSGDSEAPQRWALVPVEHPAADQRRPLAVVQPSSVADSGYNGQYLNPGGPRGGGAGLREGIGPGGAAGQTRKPRPWQEVIEEPENWGLPGTQRGGKPGSGAACTPAGWASGGQYPLGGAVLGEPVPAAGSRPWHSNEVRLGEECARTITDTIQQIVVLTMGDDRAAAVAPHVEHAARLIKMDLAALQEGDNGGAAAILAAKAVDKRLGQDMLQILAPMGPAAAQALVGQMRCRARQVAPSVTRKYNCARAAVQALCDALLEGAEEGLQACEREALRQSSSVAAVGQHPTGGFGGACWPGLMGLPAVAPPMGSYYQAGWPQGGPYAAYAPAWPPAGGAVGGAPPPLPGAMAAPPDRRPRGGRGGRAAGFLDRPDVITFMRENPNLCPWEHKHERRPPSPTVKPPPSVPPEPLLPAAPRSPSPPRQRAAQQSMRGQCPFPRDGAQEAAMFAAAAVSEHVWHTLDLDGDPLEAQVPACPAWQPVPGFGSSLHCQPLSEAEAANSISALDCGWRLLQQLQDDPLAEFEGSDEEYLALAQRYCAPASGFTAGRCAQRASAWAEHIKRGSAGARQASPAAKQTLAWMQQGVRLDFVAPDHPLQASIPQHARKLAIVTHALQAATGRADVSSWLAGDRPSRVVFPNHKSAEQYAEFTSESIRAGQAMGVMTRWGGDQPPTVICGLRVVDDKPTKLRFCINPMYINLFVRYCPLMYEGLRDVMQYVKPDDFLCTMDDTKGYWHIPLHPSTWQYTAFQWRGEVYCFTHLPFGISSACWIYTTVKRAVYQPLRERGVRLTYMIDDTLTAARGRRRAMLQCLMEMAISHALGFYRGAEKCSPIPLQRQQFLGLIVDAAEQRFQVPLSKVADFQHLSAAATAAGALTARQVARLAGKMMAMSLAVSLAPLFSRAVHKAWSGGLRWDDLLPAPAALLAEVDLFSTQLQQANGKSWRRRMPTLTVVGDASDSQAAAFTPGGELDTPIITAFSPEEQAASSTVRELLALRHALRVLLDRYPRLVVGGCLLYQTDSHNTLTDVLGMRGGDATFPLVREVRLAAAAADVELDIAWRPRTDPLAQQADGLSKRDDPCDFSLHPEVYDGICASEALAGRRPTLDAFAASHNTKVPGAFFGAYWSPGALAVDAMAQPWAVRDGRRQLLFVNPPFGMFGEVLQKIGEERVDCILVGPNWPRWWQALLSQLPVRRSWVLPHRPDLFLPGPMLPKGRRRGGHPRYAVHVWIILWEV